MRTMQPNDAVYRVVIVATYPPLEGSEEPRTATWYFGPYSNRGVASAGLTRELKRYRARASAVGWVENAEPQWAKASLVKESL